KEIADYSGIKSTSVTRLISLTVPSVLGLLGKHVLRNKLSASGLAGYLSSQENHIVAAIPSPLESLETSFNLFPVQKSEKPFWDYSFKKFTTIKGKRWRRVIFIAVFVMVAAAVYLFFRK